MGLFEVKMDTSNYPHNSLRVVVDGVSLLDVPFEASDFETGKGLRFGSLNLTDDQEVLVREIFHKQPVVMPLEMVLEEIEVPYVYTWTQSREVYDGSLLFSIQLTPQDVVKIQVGLGEREAFGQSLRKRLLFVTKLGAHSDTRLKPRHGSTTVIAEFTGEDGYSASKGLVGVIRKTDARDYYMRSDYPNEIHPALYDFVSTQGGIAQTQVDFIQRGWDRLVCRTTLSDLPTMLRFAFVRTLLLSSP